MIAVDPAFEKEEKEEDRFKDYTANRKEKQETGNRKQYEDEACGYVRAM